MARLRANLAKGTITDAPLLIGATTVNSAELPRLPAVASPDIVAVVLDPKRKNGEPEFVHVTAYDGSATSATVVRAAEDAAKFPARQHPAGTEWAHVATSADFATVGVLAYASTNQSLASATDTSVNLQATEVDSHGFYSGGSPSRLTVPAGLRGWYLISANVQFAFHATGIRVAVLRVNGDNAQRKASAQFQAVTSGGWPTRVNVTAHPILLSAGDYVELRAYQDSGGSLNVDGQRPFTWLSMTRVAA